MPTYYFHLHNDVDVPDPEGKELPNLRQAREWAMTQARALFGQVAQHEGRVVLHHRIDIENEQGQVLDTVEFGDAVRVEK
jgi:hypothetical protein